MSRKEKHRFYEVLPVQFALYLLLRLLVMILDMIPYRATPVVARALAGVIRTIDRKHVRIARKNLEKSRGICPSDEIPSFIARVYEHLARLVIELVKAPGLVDRRQIAQHVRLERFEVFDRCKKEGKGCIAVIGHLGNWELIGIATTMIGYPLHSLMRPFDNPWINRYLLRFRTLTGQQMIPRDRALGQMIRVLQRNQILIVQVDQDARQSGV